MVRTNVGLLDPSIDSRNEGDVVIQESIWAALNRLGIDRLDVVRLPTQRPLTRDERRRAEGCSHYFVGGTNLLSSNMPFYMQWKLRPPDAKLFRGNVMLLGVGWWQYQGHPNAFTRALLKRVLTSHGHSIRDSWSNRQLGAAGIIGTNTSCPTMWDLPAEPEGRSKPGSEVVVTLTDYNRKPEQDRKLFDLLARTYERVSVWPQGSRDSAYSRRLLRDVEVLEPGLTVFEKRLDQGADYVGTRLHAGVRALQRGARATIVTVDNRALEIARDTGLPVVTRDLSSNDREYLLGERSVKLSVPHEAIEQWADGARRWLAGAP